MIEFIQKPVSEIQAMRKLEQEGNLKEQMAFLSKVVESKSADNGELAVEMTMMVQEMAMGQAKAIAEVSSMIAGMGAMNV